MNINQYLKILGLSQGYTQQELKVAYRKASMANHPDRGGSDDAMKAVNSAYEYLKKAVSHDSRYKISSSAYDELKKNQAKYDEISREVSGKIKPYFMGMIDVVAMKKYLEEVTGLKFNANLEHSSSEHHSIWYQSFKLRFTTEDKKTWFEALYSVDSHSIMQNNLGGTGKVTEYPFTLNVNAFSNNRQQFIQKKDWKSKADLDLLKDGSKVFPAAKVKKAIVNKTTKFTKRHFIETLNNAFPTKFNGEWLLVTIGKYLVDIHRSVFLRQGGYTVHQARNIETKERTTVKKFITIPETEDAVLTLIEILKEFEKSGNLRTISDSLEKHFR